MECSRPSLAFRSSAFKRFPSLAEGVPLVDMSARPILHVGYHRTATTWFQERFYPAVQNGTYLPRHVVRQALIAPRAFAFSPDAAREQLMEHSAGQRLLICEENLSGYLHNGGLGGLLSKEIAGRLRDTLPDAHVVVFIRSQPRIVAAAYAQYVKGGGTHSLRRYIDAQELKKGAERHWYKAPLFSLDHFEYGPLLEHYASLFGRGAITVKLYEQFASQTETFLETFASQLALKVHLQTIDMKPINVSMSPRQLGIMRRLNFLTSRSVIDKHFYVNVSGWYFKRWIWCSRLERLLAGFDRNDIDADVTDELMLKIEKRFCSSNVALASDWNLPLAEFGYPMTP